MENNSQNTNQAKENQSTNSDAILSNAETQQTSPMNAETLKTIKVSAIAALITTIIVGAAFINLTKEGSNFLNNSSPIVRTVSESENSVIDAVEKANPAVVAITISKNVPTYERYYENVPNPFGFFGGWQVPQVRQNGTELQEVGGGSGFLVSSDGFIVTNRHVVADEQAQYTVFTNDGKKYEAKVVGRDSLLDLAVIKIDGSGFPSLNFGDSDQIQVGQTTIAIGNALGEFRNTVSTGIVSGLARSITASDQSGASESLDQLIQTDAAINSGNSGGPLLNLSGEVIGVNVAVANNANGIGFALSSNSVKSIVESVKQNGKIVRPYLGVRYTPITESIKQENNLPVDYGVLIAPGETPDQLAVIPGSPADKAGNQPNDIILEVDGKKIDDSNSLAPAIGKKKVGDAIKLKLLSKGVEKELTATLEEMK